MAPQRIRIGTVLTVNAARRETRLKPLPAYHGACLKATWLRFAPENAPELRCKVATARESGGVVIVQLAPGVARDTVALLKGVAVVAAPEEVKARQASLVAEDLLGMTLVEENARVLGSVTEAYTGSANDVIGIQLADERTVLLPLIEELVVSIDWEQGTIVVRDIAPYAVTDED